MYVQLQLKVLTGNWTACQALKGVHALVMLASKLSDQQLSIHAFVRENRHSHTSIPNQCALRAAADARVRHRRLPWADEFAPCRTLCIDALCQNDIQVSRVVLTNTTASTAADRAY